MIHNLYKVEKSEPWSKEATVVIDTAFHCKWDSGSGTVGQLWVGQLGKKRDIGSFKEHSKACSAAK